jgi:hypothetical protein
MATFGNGTTPYKMESPPTSAKGIITSALIMEGTHMEPTIGQIWPR